MKYTMCIVLIFLFKTKVICDVKMILWWKKHVCIYRNNYIGFPGQFRRIVIPFDEGVIQIREINLGHEIRSSNLYFGRSNSHFGQEI